PAHALAVEAESYGDGGYVPIYALAGAGARVRYDHIIASDVLQYGHIVSNHTRGRQSAHYLSFQPGGDVRAIVSAGGNVFGAANINTVISRAQNQGLNVLGGVNSDFFSFQTGVPEGIYISNGQLRSSHQGRGAVFFREDGSAFLGNPYLTFTLTNQSGQQVSTSLFNKFRQPGWIYLLDENFSDTTRTTTPGREVFMRITGGSVTVGGEVSLEVTNIVNSAGAMNIPAGYMVLSADASSPMAEQLDRFAVGDRITLRVSSTDGRATEAAWASGGGDILVTGGNRTSGWDAGVGGAHPRTALGIRPDGSVILYAVDGRIAGHSEGLTLAELADELISLGASYVINLDGGGSTSFAYRMPGSSSTTVLNRPSAGSLRNCATFILLTSTNPAGGGAAHIQFHPGHAAVLGGSLIRPADVSSQITMTDRGHFPVSTEGLQFTRYEADAALGAQGYDASTFRTAVANTSGLLTVYGGNGARGQVRLDLFAQPERIDIRRGGQNVTSLTLTAGDQVQLNYHAVAGGRDLFASRDMITIDVTNNVATLDDTGRLTATGAPGSGGRATVTMGGVSRSVDIQIATTFPDTAGHWAESYIGRMRDAGVITGIVTDEGTRFFPNRNVTRAEFAAMFTRLLGLDPSQFQLSGNEFVDHAQIPNWARPYVAAMFQNGYITGAPNPGGGVRFNPGAPISRAEAFVILGRQLEGDAPLHVLNQFTDHEQIPNWARTEIARLVHAGLLTGSNGRLMPLSNLSRAEAATILARLNLPTPNMQGLEAEPELPPEEAYQLPEPAYELPEPDEPEPEPDSAGYVEA
ncbi:MAG: phosphodiester glycosidase family protein, partial [Oscillospiraceae bacterium]|nr:phosphodiester glycosidase family protein [Oscillospiraceae bacterium]